MKSSLADSWDIQPAWTGFSFLCAVLLWILDGSVCGSESLGLAGTILASHSVMQSQKSPEEIEYQVKAAFIYNFMKFTEWPKESMDPPLENGEAGNQNGQDPSLKPPMIIGIVGDNPFGKAFDPLLDKKIKDRSFQIIQIPGMSDYLRRGSDRSQAVQRYFQDYRKALHACHVLVYCKSEKNTLQEHLREVREGAILTIGDVEDFVAYKGIIGFVKEDNKIRFEIHLSQAERQQLKISSQLLKLARRVIQEKDSNAQESN